MWVIEPVELSILRKSWTENEKDGSKKKLVKCACDTHLAFNVDFMTSAFHITEGFFFPTIFSPSNCEVAVEVRVELA